MTPADTLLTLALFLVLAWQALQESEMPLRAELFLTVVLLIAGVAVARATWGLIGAAR